MKYRNYVVIIGYGDMAVSNAIGSNVFDILLCLGLPWFIKTAIVNPGSQIKVYSAGKSGLQVQVNALCLKTLNFNYVYNVNYNDGVIYLFTIF